MSRILYSVNYWIILFSVLFGNVIGSLAIIPALIVFNDVTLIILLALLGGAYGLFTETLIRNIEKTRESYYALVVGAVPLIVFMNFFLVAMGANALATLLGVSLNIHNPTLVGAVYAVSFLVPFLYRLKDVLRK
jgi:hypothetical protein